MARELLELTGLPVVLIALTLDFPTPSDFVHAFRRWAARPRTVRRIERRAVRTIDAARAICRLRGRSRPSESTSAKQSAVAPGRVKLGCDPVYGVDKTTSYQ